MRLKTRVPILIFCLAAPSALSAQEGRGTITGRVTDVSGAAVAGAEIRIINKETRVTAAVRTNDAGNYTIPYVLPGTYDLVAEFAGFTKAERQNIEVRVGDVLDIDIALQVGNNVETVVVTGATPLLEAATVSLGQVVDQRRIAELPIQAGNADELVLLTPGVVNTTNLKARKASFNNAASQFSTDGGAQFSNEYTLDGVPNTFSVGSTPNNPVIAFQPPESAVSEFKVLTSAFDASVGHTPGAIVNLITKGGTNQFHGELHEWFVNSALDAPTFFVNRSGQKKQVYQDNRYGASLGGPVRIPKVYNGTNRSFFYYAWEANKWGKPTSVVGTVPTADERNGDLSALLALGSKYQIYNPFSTKPASGGARDPFMCDAAGNPLPPNAKGIQPVGTPCNKIPASLLDPVAQKIMSYYALPNSQGTLEGQNNYTRATNDLFDYYVHFFRFDHNFSEKNRLFVRLDYDHQTENQSNFYGNVATGLLLTRINRGLAVDEVLVLSPSNVLDLRYGLTSDETPERRRSQGFDVASLGYSPTLLALLDKSVTTFPNVFIGRTALSKPCSGPCTGTFSGFGNFRDGDGTTTGLIHDLGATLDTFRGKHDLRYGTDLRLYRAFGHRGGYDVSPGFQFLPTYTKKNDAASAAPIGQEFAAFLLGIPSGQMQRSASYATQDKFVGLFVQDTWKVTHKFTFNLGLRYEYESPETERFNRAIRGFDRTTPNPSEAQALANYAKNPISQLPVSQFHVLGGLMFAGPNARGLWEGQKANFLPRIGLAYQVNDKTVVRSGYGIFYDTIGINRSIAIQTGFTATTPINASLDNGLTYVATTANPFPNGLLAPLGTSGGLTTNLGQPLSVYPVHRMQPYSQRWALSLQRLLPGQFLIDVGYVGNKGLHLPVDREINPVNQQFFSPPTDFITNELNKSVPNPFFGLNSVYPKTIKVADLLRPYPEFSSITETQPIGYSLYHSLQVRAEKRFSHGYTLNVAYTWSKAMDALRFLNPGDAALEYSISENDRPHRLVISGLCELPIGRGRAFASNLPKSLDYAIGGWQLNGVVAQQSGPPLRFDNNVILSGSFNAIALPSDQRSVDRWFNTSVFDTNSVHYANADYRIRTFPHFLSNVRGDGQSKWDFSLIKHFPITERVRLQFRAETYNALNHPNFDTPNTTVTGSTFGFVNSQGGLSREFQFALKLTF